LRLLTDLAIERKDHILAAAYSQQALQLCRDLGNRSEIAAVYYQLAVIARYQNQLATAREQAEQALSMFETMGDRGFTAVTYYELSHISALQLDYPIAKRHGLESVKLFQEVGQRFNLVYVLHHLGHLARDSGQPVEASGYWKNALAVAEAIDHPLIDSLRDLMREPMMD
jgi:tetratricopeptide (TPR) repeat protein